MTDLKCPLCDVIRPTRARLATHVAWHHDPYNVPELLDRARPVEDVVVLPLNESPQARPEASPQADAGAAEPEPESEQVDTEVVDVVAERLDVVAERLSCVSEDFNSLQSQLDEAEATLSRADAIAASPERIRYDALSEAADKLYAAEDLVGYQIVRDMMREVPLPKVRKP